MCLWENCYIAQQRNRYTCHVTTNYNTTGLLSHYYCFLDTPPSPPPPPCLHVGPAPEYDDVKVCWLLPGAGVPVAEEAGHGRLCHHHLAGGAEDLVSPREHLHRL